MEKNTLKYSFLRADWFYSRLSWDQSFESIGPCKFNTEFNFVRFC